MFGELNKYNRTIREGVNTENMDFYSLKEFCGRTIRVDGFFFNQGKYGEQVVVVGEGCLINMPERAVEQFKTIEKSEEMLEAVMRGKLGIKDLHMVNTKNGTTVAYTLYDI